MIRLSLLLLPLCGAWIIPPHVENAPVEGTQTACENFTYENWLHLQVEPHHFNEDAIQFLEEAFEVTDYVEPEDDPDFDPNESENLDDTLLGDNEVERFRRSLDDDEDEDDVYPGGGIDVPIDGGVDLTPENSSVAQPIAFLKLKQKGRDPSGELLKPHQPALIMLKNYQKAPMSFFVTVSPFEPEDEESSAAFYEDAFPMQHPEFFKLDSCWLNHTLAESGICKHKHHHGHHNNDAHSGHRGHGKNHSSHHEGHGHDHHEGHGHGHHEGHGHGHHEEHGHGHHHHGNHRGKRHHGYGDGPHSEEGHEHHGPGHGPHSEEGHEHHGPGHGCGHHGHHGPGHKHGHHGPHGGHESNQEHDNHGDHESNSHEGHGGPRNHHQHPHDEADIMYVHYEHEDEHSDGGHTEHPTTENSGEDNVNYGEGIIDLRNVDLEANADSAESETDEDGKGSSSCGCKKCQRKSRHERAEGKGAICPHAMQGWVEAESKAVVEYLVPNSGCFVIRAYVSFPLEDGSMILTSDGNEEFLEHFDCVQPNPVPEEEINDYDDDSSDESSDFDSDESGEDNFISGEEEDDSHEVDGHPRRRHKRQNSLRELRLERRADRAMKKQDRKKNRENRRRNRQNAVMGPNAINRPRTGNRWLMKNETTLGGKFCCREGILHKKSSTYKNEDGSHPTLQCEGAPSEVTLWANHKHDIEADTCQLTYTRCCEDFDIEQWEAWVARREARLNRRQGGRRRMKKRRFRNRLN